MSPIDVAARMEIHGRLLGAVRALAEPYRSAIWLRYLEGKESSDIARMLGVPVETVRTRLKRGVDKLRRDLDRSLGDRAGWISSVAAFAGVEPSMSVLSAGAVAMTGAAKTVAAASVVLIVAGATYFAAPLPSPFRTVTPRESATAKPADRSNTAAPPSATADNSAVADEANSVPVVGAERTSVGTAPWTDSTAPTAAPADSVVEGEFSFHYQQGYSFVSRSVVKDLADADLVFKTCAGGISSVTFEAPSGAITNLERLSARFPDLKHGQALSRSIVRADPKSFGSGTTPHADDRAPTSNAFLLRTKHGHWVSLAIVERGEIGGWSQRPVKVYYAMNATAPSFRKGTSEVTLDGIAIDAEAVPRFDREAQEEADRAHEARIAPFRRRLEELDREAENVEPAIQARDGSDVRVAAVLEWHFATPMGDKDGNVAATFSFQHATRDDVKATLNDWDFAFEQSRIRVRTVTDDVGYIWNLGDTSMRSARSGNFATTDREETAEVVLGRLYAVHTVDSNTDQWALMRVETVRPGESLIFSWVVLKDPAPLRKVLSLGHGAGWRPPMSAPSARLQIRGGAGGGNPFRASLDASLERVESLSATPLDLQSSLSINERHVAFVDGGTVPTDMIFLIEHVEYTARVEGDSNGPGEFALHVGSADVVHIRESHELRAEKDKRFLWSESGREAQSISSDVMPVRGELSVSIPIREGMEHSVYVEIANSSWADVTLSGRFVAAPTTASDSHGAPPEGR